jgi:dynein heavy chain
MDFLHMDVHAVAVGIAKQAEIWKEDYGESLHASSFGLLSKLTDRISALESNLMSETNDLDQLKFVLNVIHDIAAVSPDMDLDLLDVSERYRTLARYGVNVPQTETQSAMTLDKRWHKLFCDSKTRGESCLTS